jgi:predicted Zn-dependent protease
LQDDLARRLLARTGEVYDDVPAGRLLAGILELRTGNPVLAVDEFDALVRRQPDNAAAALLLGRALLASGDAREVVARLGPQAERSDATPYLLALVGRAYEHLGNRAAAARYLDRAAAARPALISGEASTSPRVL